MATKEKTKGTVEPNRKYGPMRICAGKCTAETGVEYELYNGANGVPMVQNQKTKKWYSLSWREIVDMARDKGIDDEA